MRISAETMRSLIQDGVEVYSKDGEKTVKPLIEPVSPDRFNFIEGSGYDLTLAKVYAPATDYGPPFIGVEERMIPPGLPVRLSVKDGKEVFVLSPGGAFLLESVETVNLPIWLDGPIKPRTTLFRSFGSVTFANAQPNYQGKLVGLLIVHHPLGMLLEKGCRFAQIKFAAFDSLNTDPYEGIWGGDRVTTDGRKDRAF